MGDAGLTAPTSIPAPRRLWSDAEWERLRKGASSGDWSASVAGDRLSLAEAGTDEVLYEARFRRELAGWKIISAEVESDPGSYVPGSEEKESERLQSILERLVG
ncbi:MAG: hypothetical protein ACRD12_15285 [Acidimicrobiales bacterium]